MENTSPQSLSSSKSSNKDSDIIERLSVKS